MFSFGAFVYIYVYLYGSRSLLGPVVSDSDYHTMEVGFDSFFFLFNVSHRHSIGPNLVVDR